MLEVNKIYNQDCLEGMRLLDDKSVDVTFTSPPYNDTGSDNVNVADSGMLHKKYLYTETKDNYFDWLCECIDEMLRVSKKWVIFNIQGIKNNREDVYKIIGKYAHIIHDIVIWYKPYAQPTGTPHSISNNYEFIILFKCKGVENVKVNSNFYRNVIVKGGNANSEYAKVHRAVMNKEISDEIIKEFTVGGDVVLDPFTGCGTTELSCKQQGRNYIGFEICKEYWEIANDRLEGVLYQPSKDEKQIIDPLF